MVGDEIPCIALLLKNQNVLGASNSLLRFLKKKKCY